MKEDTPAKRLRQAREGLGFTRAQLAGKLSKSESMVRAHELGQNQIQPDAALAYAKELNVSPSWLLFGEETFAESRTESLTWALDIPVLGILRDGFFPKDSIDAKHEPHNIALPIPGFERNLLRAYQLEYVKDDRFRNYNVVAPTGKVGLYLGDYVALEVTRGDLMERTLWQVGGASGWLVFFKGETQSRAYEILKLRPDNADAAGVKIIGVVVAEFSHRRIQTLRQMELLSLGTNPHEA